MTYQRIVCFRFKRSAIQDHIQHHMDSFAGLKDAVPYILSYRGGRTVPEGDHTRDWDSLHCVTFQDQGDIELYHDHKAHQEFIRENRGIWDKVFVLNATIE